MITKITEKSFEREVLGSDVPVLLEFYASWCGKCAMMEDIAAGFAENYEGSIKVCQVDIDICKMLAQKFGVELVPTFIAFHGGEATGAAVGIVSLKTLESLFV